MKKWIAAILSVTLTLTLILALTGCGASKIPDTAEETMVAMLNHFKAGKDTDRYFTAGGVQADFIDQDEMEDFFRLLMDVSADLDYSIESSAEKGDTAVVTVSITTTRTSNMLGDFFSEMLSVYFEEAFQSTLSGEEFTDERAAEIRSEVSENVAKKYKDGEYGEKLTSEAEVSMVKEADGWLIESKTKNDLVFAMLGFDVGGLTAVFGEYSDFLDL